MTISGSYDFTLNTNQIIKHAYRKVGKVSDTMDLSAEQYLAGRELLNVMVNAWSAEGIYLWAIEDLSIPFVNSSKVQVSGVDYECILNHSSAAINQPGAGSTWQSYWKKLSSNTASAWASETSYTAIGNIALDTSIIGVNSARIRNISLDETTTSTLKSITQKEYFSIQNAQTLGAQTQYYFRRRETVDLFIFPLPEDTSTYMLELQIYKALADLDTGTDTADFLREWSKTLIDSLAVELAPQAGIFGTQLKDLRALADESKALARLSNRETGDLQLSPDLSSYVD